MRQSEQIGKISAALNRAQKNMGNAVKDSANPFFRSKYADINAIREAIMPSLLAEGITVLQPPAHVEGKNFIETVLVHESGEFLASLNEVIVAKQNDPQSYLAAQTYTRRGALQAFLNVGADDDDGNTANGRTETKSVRSAVASTPAAPKAEEKKEAAPAPVAAGKIEEKPKRSFRRNVGASEDL
jgi:hypothetical protein